jgi:hypothetical protein
MGIESTVFDGAFAVQKSDIVSDPNGPFAALYIGVAGNIAFADGSGNAVAATAVSAGIFPVRVIRVNNTNTTATGILGLKAVP